VWSTARLFSFDLADEQVAGMIDRRTAPQGRGSGLLPGAFAADGLCERGLHPGVNFDSPAQR
jgi:hypothetical protein